MPQPHIRKIKCRCGVDKGMMEQGLIAGACVLAIYAGLIVFGLWLRSEIDDIVQQLDANLAAAIQKVLVDLPIGDIEPPNPFQILLMQLIQDNMASKKTIQARGAGGLFVSESETESEHQP